MHFKDTSAFPPTVRSKFVYFCRESLWEQFNLSAKSFQLLWKINMDARLYLADRQVDVCFSKDNSDFMKFGQLRLFDKYSQKYLIGYPIIKGSYTGDNSIIYGIRLEFNDFFFYCDFIAGEVCNDTIALPSYMPVTVRTAIGLLDVDESFWPKWKEQLTDIVNGLHSRKAFRFPDGKCTYSWKACLLYPFCCRYIALLYTTTCQLHL